MVDTHLHLWNPERFDYHWLFDTPALNRSFDLADYLHAKKESAIDVSMFVECAVSADSTQDEARWALELASDPENRIAGVVASVWPEAIDFQEKLNSLAPHPRLKGVRRVLHTEPDDLSRSAHFRRNVASLSRHDLCFDICALERQLPWALELIQACPDNSFVLDHCGIPLVETQPSAFWLDMISRIATHPNAFCKVSVICLYANEDQRSASGLFPWFSHVIERFGWARVMWGSDWPVCTLARSLRSWLTISQELLDLAGATDEESARFFDRNARSFYRL